MNTKISLRHQPPTLFFGGRFPIRLVARLARLVQNVHTACATRKAQAVIRHELIALRESSWWGVVDFSEEISRIGWRAYRRANLSGDQGSAYAFDVNDELSKA